MADIDQMVELLRSANEVEAREIETLLKQAGIDCRLVSLSQTPYPGTGLEGAVWGRVLVPTSQLAKAEEIAAAYIESEPEPIGEAWRQGANAIEPAPLEKSARPSLAAVLLWTALVLSVALNVLLWARLSGLESTKDSEGRVVGEAIYGWNKSYPYEWRIYDTKGVHIASWFDEDDNGRMEFGVDLWSGQPEMRWYDHDQDGIYERTVIYSNDAVVLEMLDQNGDGLIERAGVPHQGKLVPPLFSDVDGDGRYDLVDCLRQGRGVRFYVRSCTEAPAEP